MLEVPLWTALRSFDEPGCVLTTLTSAFLSASVLMNLLAVVCWFLPKYACYWFFFLLLVEESARLLGLNHDLLCTFLRSSLLKTTPFLLFILTSLALACFKHVLAWSLFFLYSLSAAPRLYNRYEPLQIEPLLTSLRVRLRSLLATRRPRLLHRWLWARLSTLLLDGVGLSCTSLLINV